MYLYVIHYSALQEERRFRWYARPLPPSSVQVVGYLRVSTDEQSLSVEAQRATLTAWCQARRLTLVAVYEDVNVSGGAG